MVDPQLDADDIALMRSTRRDIMAGRQVPIDIKINIVTGVDDYTNLPTTVTTTTTVSGILQEIMDDDRLLLLAGRVRVGDTKMILHYDDVIPAIAIEDFRRASILAPSPSGVEYIVDVLLEEGMGGPSRFEVGLVRV